MRMNFSTTPEFDRELKRFKKSWPSLDTDFDSVYKTLPLLYTLQDNEIDADLKIRRDGFFNNKRATILHPNQDGSEVVKMRLDCVSLGNKDILRLVFVYVKSDDKTNFIELYSKKDKQREDQSRIKKYF